MFCSIRIRDKNINHLFIHLNLCIALALGLIVFIGGIENAVGNQVASYSYNITNAEYTVHEWTI